MAETYTIQSLLDFRVGAQEIPYTAIAGHPYLSAQAASLAILNLKNSGKVVKVTDFTVRDLAAPNTTSPTALLLVRATSWTIGTPNFLKIVPLNSTNNSLPSGIMCWENVQAITAGTALRRIPNYPFYNELRALSEMCSFLHGDADSCVNLSGLYRHHDHYNTTQRHVLREGEGLALQPENLRIQYPLKVNINIFFRVVSTGHCYMACSDVVFEGRRTSWLLTNETGSGVVLEVYGVEMAEVGNDVYPNAYSMERIDGINQDTGDECLVIPHNSTNQSLTGKVFCRDECSVSIAGSKVGAIMARPIITRDWQTSIGAAPYQVGAPLEFGSKNSRLWHRPNELTDVVLREGEGVAVFKRTMSEIGKAQVVLRFTVEDAQAPAGGSGYSRNRVVNA